MPRPFFEAGVEAVSMNRVNMRVITQFIEFFGAVSFSCMRA